MEVLGVTDWVIGLIIGIFILVVVFFYKVTFFKNKNIAQYLMPFFLLKIIVTLLNLLIAKYYYNGASDAIHHYMLIIDVKSNGFEYLKEFFKVIDVNDISVPALTPIEDKSASVITVVKGGIILSYFAFDSFIGICLYLSLFSSMGLWVMFSYACKYIPQANRYFAISFLYLPSILFWTTGLLKETYCIGALGFLLVALVELFYRKKQIVKNLITIIINTIIIFFIKPYFLIIIPCFFLYLFLELNQNLKDIKDKFVFIFTPLSIFSIILFYFLSNQFSDPNSLIARYSFESVIEGAVTGFDYYSTQDGSFVELPIFDGSLNSLINVFFSYFLTTYFRPFPTEITSIIMIPSAIESLFFLAFTVYTLYKVGLLSAIRLIIKKPILLPLFLYCSIYPLIVCTITFNFGTIARYKIPALPFYLIFLYLLLEFSQNNKIVLIQDEKSSNN